MGLGAEQAALESRSWESCCPCGDDLRGVPVRLEGLWQGHLGVIPVDPEGSQGTRIEVGGAAGLVLGSSVWGGRAKGPG